MAFYEKILSQGRRGPEDSTVRADNARGPGTIGRPSNIPSASYSEALTVAPSEPCAWSRA